jgi:hypothetical protein
VSVCSMLWHTEGLWHVEGRADGRLGEGVERQVEADERGRARGVDAEARHVHHVHA